MHVLLKNNRVTISLFSIMNENVITLKSLLCKCPKHFSYERIEIKLTYEIMEERERERNPPRINFKEIEISSFHLNKPSKKERNKREYDKHQNLNC